jgi:hypothetical protein
MAGLQRPATGLTLSEVHQLCSDHTDFVGEFIDAPQRRLDVTAARRGEFGGGQPVAGGLRE